MKPIESLFRDTEDCYRTRATARQDRQQHLDALGHGGDWRKVDDPRRVLIANPFPN